MGKYGLPTLLPWWRQPDSDSKKLTAFSWFSVFQNEQAAANASGWRALDAAALHGEFCQSLAEGEKFPSGPLLGAD